MLTRALNYIRMTGQCSTSELSGFLGVSISTVSRHLKELIADNKVVRLGQGKNIRYIAIKVIRGITQPIVVRQVDPQANIIIVGNLWVTHNGTILETEDENIEYDDLPWFFFDLRPQGFIGRMIGRDVSRQLMLSARTDQWDSNDLLRYLVLTPRETSGNFELFYGYKEVKLALGPVDTRQDLLKNYDKHVKKSVFVEFEENGGSSAGGEQPKFNSRICPDGLSKICIVKYSPLLNKGNPTAERVKDLLICEHYALEELRHFNGLSTKTEFFFSNERLYLEIERFDRSIVNGKEGQRGMVSLESVIAQFVGYAGNWAEASDSLYAEGVLNSDDATLLKLWLAYSRFIGNTDTHNGNVSLYINGIIPDGLTPAYDMLPMAYMPSKADLPMPKVKVIRPDLINDDTWQQGRELALKFWNRVLEEQCISTDFKEIANQWIEYLEKDSVI